MSKTNNSEKGKEFYNKIYVDGGSNKAYHKEPEDTLYYELWKKIINLIRENNVKNISDVGCGNGQFSRLIKKNIDINTYYGIDFSDKAINYAKNKLPDKNYKYEIQDFNIMKPLFFNDTCYICLEVLEHIDKDIELIQKMTGNNNMFIFSVPNYNSKGHVRIFENENQVYNRYKNYIDIKKIIPVNITKTHIIWLFYGLMKNNDTNK